MEGEKISEVVNGRREDIRSCEWKERRYQKLEMEGEKISEVVNGRREDIRSCKWKERRYQKKKDIKSSSFRSIV